MDAKSGGKGHSERLAGTASRRSYFFLGPLPPLDPLEELEADERPAEPDLTEEDGGELRPAVPDLTEEDGGDEARPMVPDLTEEDGGEDTRRGAVTDEERGVLIGARDAGAVTRLAGVRSREGGAAIRFEEAGGRETAEEGEYPAGERPASRDLTDEDGWDDVRGEGVPNVRGVEGAAGREITGEDLRRSSLFELTRLPL